MRAVYIQSFTHLKDQFDADRALHLLQRVASLVKPIMRKRGWVLPVLAEFFPENPNLQGDVSLLKVLSDASRQLCPGLNENMGQKILLRLRPAHSPDFLLPEEDVVGTMLHELTHNVHGPHDEQFYKYLDDLQLEYKGLQWSGWDGDSFLSVGQRLGTDFSSHVPPQVARLKALEAAEKRSKEARALGSGGRLGGSAKKKGSSGRELAARAAEKRLQDEKSCASGAEAQREIDKAAEESIISQVDHLTLDDTLGTGSKSKVVAANDNQPSAKTSNGVAGPSKKPMPKPRGVSKTLSSRLLTANLSTAKQVISQPKAIPATPTKISQPTDLTDAGRWSCSACTLLNPADAVIQCDACQARKPYDEREGWPCLLCGQTGNIHEHWSCKFCGWIKLHS